MKKDYRSTPLLSTLIYKSPESTTYNLQIDNAFKSDCSSAYANNERSTSSLQSTVYANELNLLLEHKSLSEQRRELILTQKLKLELLILIVDLGISALKLLTVVNNKVCIYFYKNTCGKCMQSTSLK